MNRRIIRTALTVCLIVVTTMQPVSALALLGTCSGNVCEQKQTCGGCGCCDVAQVEQRCCCCSDRGDASESGPAAGDDKLSNDSVGLSQLRAVDPQISHDKNHLRVFERRCTCRIAVPPMDRTSTSDSAIRDLSLRLASLEFVLPEDVSPIIHPRMVDATPGSRADFSQRMLCVWRI